MEHDTLKTNQHYLIEKSGEMCSLLKYNGYNSTDDGILF